MRPFSLSLAVIFLSSAMAFAQHSSGGVGGSSGGSHGGSSGGSVSVSHSSSGIVSHIGSSVHSSSSASFASHSGVPRVGRAGGGVLAKMAQPEKAQPQKRSFLSYFRHPFKRPGPKTADLRRWICVKGPCSVCPAGSGKAGCVGTAERNRNYCSQRDVWNGGSCLLQTRILDECSGLRMALTQQELRMQAAEAGRQSACSAGSMGECSAANISAQSEANFYRNMMERYRLCESRGRMTYLPSGAEFGYLTENVSERAALESH